MSVWKWNALSIFFVSYLPHYSLNVIVDYLQTVFWNTFSPVNEFESRYTFRSDRHTHTHIYIYIYIYDDNFDAANKLLQ